VETGTIIAYTVTFIALFFGITAFSQSIIGGLIGRFAGHILGGLIGGIIVWLLIDWLWVAFGGGHIPIIILICALVFIFGHGIISKKELTEQSNWMMAAELWAIILLGTILFIKSDVVRWY
jgi:hypothetical protein